MLRNIDHLFQNTQKFALAPDSGLLGHGNTGFMFIQPSLQTYQKLLNLNKERASFDGTDQGLLNSFCSSLGKEWMDRSADDAECGKLHTSYNLNLDFIMDYKVLEMGSRSTPAALPSPRVLHYSGARVRKPWEVIGEALSSGKLLRPGSVPEIWWRLGYEPWYAMISDML